MEGDSMAAVKTLAALPSNTNGVTPPNRTDHGASVFVVTDRGTIGQRIARRREQLGLKQAELARKVRMSEAYINRLENGLVRSPKLYDLTAVAEVLDLPLEAVVYAEGKRAPESELGILSKQPRLASALLNLARGLEWADSRDREFAISNIESLAKRFGVD
jgi:transcriptional regulator with XRE-family HTH domain